MFSQPANAEPKQRALGNDKAAEGTMKAAGYENWPDDTSRCSDMAQGARCAAGGRPRTDPSGGG
jgi:hypothetical protein